jgi:uncharacterized protein (UPF0248 family)
MLELLGAKLYTGIVALSLLLFSSFQGNDPRLSAITVQKSENYLHLSGSLISAFDNDFPSIFSSGTPIPVHFMLQIRSGGKAVVQRRFTHTVSFDTATGVYELGKSGTGEVYRSDRVEDIIREVSRYRFGIPYQADWGSVSIKIDASLPRVNFEQLNKEVDLMVLWKHKIPSARTTADLRRAQ